VNHGDEDTYTDYLRTKKTVELRYSTVVSNNAEANEEERKKFEKLEESFQENNKEIK